MPRRSPQTKTSNKSQITVDTDIKKFPGYPTSPRMVADESPALSPEQIPQTEMEEMDLPNDVETAEALGLGLQELSDEISEEERQHHPEQQGEVEHETGLAEELDRRIAGRSRQ